MHDRDMTPEQPLSFEAFASYIEDELGAELPASSRDLLIGVDLELDSVTMLELVVAIEELGVELPADAFITARTLGEVYDKYLAVAGSGAVAGEADSQGGG